MTEILSYLVLLLMVVAWAYRHKIRWPGGSGNQASAPREETRERRDQAELELLEKIRERRDQAENRKILQKAGFVLGVRNHERLIERGSVSVPEPAKLHRFYSGAFEDENLRIDGKGNILIFRRRSPVLASYTAELSIVDKATESMVFDWSHTANARSPIDFERDGMNGQGEIRSYLPGSWERHLDATYKKAVATYPALTKKARDNGREDLKKRFGV